jgi:hypothetical protein
LGDVLKITPENDFGFTAMSSEQMRQTLPVASSVIKVTGDKRVEKILAIVNPLLEALQRDPEKDKLHWPKRAEVAKKIQEKIKNIAEGKEDDTNGKATKEHDDKGGTDDNA